MEIRLTINAAPRTKKTSNRIMGYGKRCKVCHRPAFSKVLPSGAFESLEAVAVPALRRDWRKLTASLVAPDSKSLDVQCDACKGRGWKAHRDVVECDVCDGKGSVPVALPGTWNAAVLVYRDALRGDLIGYLQAVADLLQAAGVLENDAQIIGWDRSRMLKDADRPRFEITLTPLADPNRPAQADLFGTAR